jgi:hypothetical protein
MWAESLPAPAFPGNNLLRQAEILSTITTAMSKYWRYFWFSFTDAAYFGRWRRAGGRA